MVYDRSRGYETTAIDSGKIWTTERIYTDESRQVTEISHGRDSRDGSFVDFSTPGLVRSYDAGKSAIPRPSYDGGRQRSEVCDFRVSFGDGVFLFSRIFEDLDLLTF